ncbi:hypothetical protein [Halorarius halobius]|uniref:hypothetical protein n=1 Tax=Halorarius halobius TaxID=2962671 RepID=UPI0020CD343E|nr:hypothetical protein [Halorarius halobius]
MGQTLFSQEFSYSTGYLTAILNGCLFAPSLLTFWFVNGVLDFSTAVAIGAVGTPAGLQVRLLAYLLLVPTFLLARVITHLLHPTHRTQVLAGSCPSSPLMSLDWVSMGILATGLPLAIQNFGPWFGMNVIFLVGVFVLPRVLPAHLAGAFKLFAIVLGGTVFLYASYGGVVSMVPHPSRVLGPVATVTLSDDTTLWLSRLVNSIMFGPILVGAFGVIMNHVLTRPELTDIPFVRHTLPRRDPDLVVVTSAAFGTAFYLVVVAVATGELVFVP